MNPRYKLESPYRTIGITLNFEDIDKMTRMAKTKGKSLGEFGRMLLLDSLDDFLESESSISIPIEDIPDGSPLTENQSSVRTCVI